MSLCVKGLNKYHEDTGCLLGKKEFRAKLLHCIDCEKNSLDP